MASSGVDTIALLCRSHKTASPATGGTTTILSRQIGHMLLWVIIAVTLMCVIPSDV